MPTNEYGQMLTFASQFDPTNNLTQYVWIRAQRGDTIRIIAARRGHPELVPAILALNAQARLKNGHYLRSATQTLQTNQLIRLPGTLAQQDSFSVLCQDSARPIVKDGYARFDTVDRPGRVGLDRFLGYNPIAIDCPVQFENYAAFDGTQIEADITILERMMGRGDYAGAASGPPAVVRVSVTGNRGGIVPLIPLNYQWSPSNPTAPLYRIGGTSWQGGDLSDDQGQRIRALATISLVQYTPIVLTLRSSAQRARAVAS